MSKRIYFDNNATTPLAPEVRETMLPYLGEVFGNPSSAHRFGEAARYGVEQARGRVAGLLRTSPDRLVFTSGGSEANNLAIWSAVLAAPGKKHLISSRVEHDSVLQPLSFLSQKFGYALDLLPVAADGALALDLLERTIRPETVLVSLMGANNETGVLWPFREIAALCREKGVFFHCDAVQLAGKIDLGLEDFQGDYLTLSAHKLHGPKGTGVLWHRRTAPLTPLVMGSGQEKGRRSGTENVPGIVGFGRACVLARRTVAEEVDRLAAMRGRLETIILERIEGVLINGRSQPRIANTLNVSFEHCSAAAMIQDLDERGVAVSAHSACHSGDPDSSHVLDAMKVPDTYRHGTLRISLSSFNTMDEVEAFLKLLPQVVAKSRQGAAL